jgi:hypothetical protein
MNLSNEVDLEDYVSRPDKINVGDVSAFPFIGLFNILAIYHEIYIIPGILI